MPGFNPEDFIERLRLLAEDQGHVSLVGAGPGIIAAPGTNTLPEFLVVARDALQEAFHGLNPIASHTNDFFVDDPVKRVLLFDPVQMTASVRFWFSSSVAAGDEVFGFRFHEPIPSVALPVSVSGRYTVGAWRVHVLFDALDLLTQLGVKAMGRPVAR